MKAIKLSLKDRLTKRVLAIVVVVTMLVSLLLGWLPNRDVVAVGARVLGTPISTVAQFQGMGGVGSSGEYHLIDNLTINLNEPNNFQPLHFSGILDGRGHTITVTGNRTLLSQSLNDIYWGALFTEVTGTIKNLDVVLNVSIDIRDTFNTFWTSPNYMSHWFTRGGWYLGRKATHHFPDAFLGGIVGHLNGGEITNTSVRGSFNVMRSIDTYQDYSTNRELHAVILNSNYYAGGIAGQMSGSALISTCFIDGLNIIGNTGTNSYNDFRCNSHLCCDHMSWLWWWDMIDIFGCCCYVICYDYVCCCYVACCCFQLIGLNRTIYRYQVFAANIVGQLTGGYITNNLIGNNSQVDIGSVSNRNFIGYAGGIFGHNAFSTSTTYVNRNVIRDVTIRASNHGATNCNYNVDEFNGTNYGFVGYIGGFAQENPIDLLNFVHNVTTIMTPFWTSGVSHFYGTINNPSLEQFDERNRMLPMYSDLNIDHWIDSRDLNLLNIYNGPTLRWNTVMPPEPRFTGFDDDDDDVFIFELFPPTEVQEPWRGDIDRWTDPNDIRFRIVVNSIAQLAAPILEKDDNRPGVFEVVIPADADGSLSALGLDDEDIEIFWYYEYRLDDAPPGSPDTIRFDPLEGDNFIDLRHHEDGFVTVFMQTQMRDANDNISNSVISEHRITVADSSFNMPGQLTPYTPADEDIAEVYAELSMDISLNATSPSALILNSNHVGLTINSTSLNLNNNEVNVVSSYPEGYIISYETWARFPNAYADESEIIFDISVIEYYPDSDPTVIITLREDPSISIEQPFGILAQPRRDNDGNNTINFYYPDTARRADTRLHWRVDDSTSPIGGQSAIGESLIISATQLPTCDDYPIEILVWSQSSNDSFLRSSPVTIEIYVEGYGWGLERIDSPGLDGRGSEGQIILYCTDLGRFINRDNNSVLFRYPEGNLIPPQSRLYIYFWHNSDRAFIDQRTIVPPGISTPPIIEPSAGGNEGLLNPIILRPGNLIDNVSTVIYYELYFFGDANPIVGYTLPLLRTDAHTIEWDTIKYYFRGEEMRLTASAIETPIGGVQVPIPNARSDNTIRVFHHTQKARDDPPLIIDIRSGLPGSTINADRTHFFAEGERIGIRLPDGIFVDDSLQINISTGDMIVHAQNDGSFVIEADMIDRNSLTIDAWYTRTNFPDSRPIRRIVNIRAYPRQPIPSIPTNERIRRGETLRFFLHPDDFMRAERVYYVPYDTESPDCFTEYTQRLAFDRIPPGMIRNFRPVVIVTSEAAVGYLEGAMPIFRYYLNNIASEYNFGRPEIWLSNNNEYRLLRDYISPRETRPLTGAGQNIVVDTVLNTRNPNFHLALREEAYLTYNFQTQLPTPEGLPSDETEDGMSRRELDFNYTVYLFIPRDELIQISANPRMYYTVNEDDPEVIWNPLTRRYDVTNGTLYNHDEGIWGYDNQEGRLTIRAIAVLEGYEPSRVSALRYYVRPQTSVPSPSVLPPTSTVVDADADRITVVESGTRISLFAAIANARIRYGIGSYVTSDYVHNRTQIVARGEPGDLFMVTAMAFLRTGNEITGEEILRDSEPVTFVFRIADQVTAQPPTSWPVTTNENVAVVQRGSRVTLQSPNGLHVIYSIDGRPNPEHVRFTGPENNRRLEHVNNNAVTRATRIYDSATGITIEGELGGLVNISAMAFAGPDNQSFHNSDIVTFTYSIETRQAATPVATPTTEDGIPRILPNNSLITLRTPTTTANIYYSTIGTPIPGHADTTTLGANSGTIQISGAPGEFVNIRTIAIGNNMLDSDMALFTFQIEELQVVQPPTAWPRTTPEETAIVPLGSYIFLQSETTDATIYYSRTGAPNRRLTDGGIRVEGTPGTTFRIHAQATAPGMRESDIVIFTYQIADLNVVLPPVAWPRTTPEEIAVVPLGSHIVLQSDTPNAVISYSRSGTPNRPFPSGGIPVEGDPGTTFRIHARATVPGMRESDVVIFTYQIADLNRVLAPTAWPQTTPEVEEIAVVALGSHIFLQSDTPNATIYYSNTSVPDRLFPNDGILVEGTPGSTFRIHAHARVPGMQESDIIIFTYQIETMNAVAAPIATPETSDSEPTIMSRGSSIRLRSPTATATIFYSLEGMPVVENRADGSFHPAEGTNQLDVSQIITVPDDWESEFFVINAIAVADGMYDSDIATFTYRLPASVHPVQANPGSRTVVRGTEVSLSTATQYATIYFEISSAYAELTDPIPGESQVFNLPIVIESDTHIRAIAAREGEFSRITTFSYTMADQLPAPVPSIPSGSIVPRGTMLNLTTTEGASITYTKDGTDPTNPDNPSRMHGSTIALDAEAGQSISISAFAHMTGQTPSEIVSFTYSVLDSNAAIVAHPPSGSDVHVGGWITLVTQITGAEIRYAVGDTDLDNNAGTISSGGRVQVAGQPGGTFIIRAQAVSGSIESMPMMFYYNISSRAHPPNPSILDGARVTQGTRLAFNVPNGVVYYRVDNIINGLRTTGSLQTYTGPFVLQGDPGTEIRVTAFTRAEGLEDSEERVFSYRMSNQTAPPVARQVISDGTFNRYVDISGEINNVDRRQGVMISLSGATPNAVIYYTSNGTVPPVGSPEWIRYEGPFSVHRSVTINMFAVAPDMDPSENERQHIRINFIGDEDYDEEFEIDDDMDFILVYTHLETDVQLRIRFTEEGEDPILPENARLEVVRLEPNDDTFIGVRDRVIRANLSANGSEVVDVQVVELYEIHVYVEENGQTRRINNGFDEGSIRIGIPLQDSYRDAIVRVWHIPNENVLPNPLYTIRRGSRGTIFIQPPSFSHFAVVVPYVSHVNQNQGFNFQWLMLIPLLVTCITVPVFIIKKKKRDSYAPLIENDTEEESDTEQSV